MKLLIEQVNPESIQILREDVEENGIKQKIYRLKGPMIGAEVVNRNNRMYSKDLIVREVQKFNDMIKEGTACGTLDHDTEPTVSMDRISHKFESLIMVENEAIGVAKVIDTPCGRILKTLVDEKIKIGMSTRGVGSLDEDNNVKDDYQILSIDVCQSPSYAKAFVEAVVESKDWILNGGKWVCVDGKTIDTTKQTKVVECAIDAMKTKMNEKYDSRVALKYMIDFVTTIKNKK